jgi:predicted AAA+ superfamily ATPase
MFGYIKRSIEKVLRKAASQFPAIILTGPRQAGKTTLLQQLLGSSHRYVSLETPDIRAAATADPRGFLDLNPAPIIFDEIQYAPDLLFYIKERIDRNRRDYGQYVLTGSQNLLLQAKVTETLAGRAAILRLLPLSYSEIMRQQNAQFPWEARTSSPLAEPNVKALWELMLRGTYPELIEHPDKDASLWHGSYIQTYLERDVRTLRQVGDLTQFQLFLRAVAARSAQLFVASDVARDIGVSVNTIRAWLGVLEATYQVIILRPYFSNVRKRLVKTPKIYLTDVGTLCYLVGLRDIDHLATGPMAGAVFETFVVSQVYKRLLNRGIEPNVYFWRTAAGTEVDILVEDQGVLHSIEIKATATPRPSMSSGILSFRQDLGHQAGKGYVVHMGELHLPLAPEIEAIPFAQL